MEEDPHKRVIGESAESQSETGHEMGALDIPSRTNTRGTW